MAKKKKTSTSSTGLSATAGMYLDFSIPLGLTNLILAAINNSSSDPNTPQVPTTTATNRMWVSQPRPAADPHTEVVTINFKLPLSVSEVGWEALRVSCRYEVWYQDRQNNWRQVLDESRNPLALNLSAASAAAWYKAHFYCYPIVAKALQFRISRAADPNVGNIPYVVGMRNTLIRRNIYTRSDGTQGIEPQQDILGNTFTSYIKDWGASKAIDNAPSTYWKSMPMPDPSAVVSLYLDMRAPDGSAQLVDTLYIDPVYTGSPLNLYYSTDDTTGTLTLSPVAAVATTDENTQWQQGKGRWDISASDGSQTSDYEFPMAWGPLVQQDAWIGIEWTPDFDPGFSNAVQVVTIGGTPTGGSFTLTYGGQTTVGLAPDSLASQMQEALEALSSIGTGNVTVTGAPSGPWTVTFQNALGHEAISTMTTANTFTGGATVTATTTVTGGVGGGPPVDPVLFDVTPTGIAGINTVQTITLTGAPTGGTFTLSYGGQTTSALAYNINAAALTTALSGLSSIGSGNVLVTEESGAVSGPWTVEFQGALGARPITAMTATPSLTGGTDPGISIAVTTPGALPVTPGNTNQYWPKIYYDVGGGQMVLEFYNGTTSHTYTAPLSPLFNQFQPVRICAGWTYNPNTVWLAVADKSGATIGSHLDTNPTTLSNLITLDGSVGFTNFRGLFTAHVIKLEDYHLSSATFLANPQIYVSPDPVQPDANGTVPSTTLDNAIYAAAWAMQEHGTGGSHVSNFAEKTWTPVWANYVCQKGFIYLPQQVRAKYLQLEFTNLVEEPYPVYDSGIQVAYSIFPMSVTQASNKTAPVVSAGSDLLAVGADVALTGPASINWLNPQSVNNAINSQYGQTQPPVTVASTGFNSSTLPNSSATDIAGQTSNEVSSAWVYKRSPLSSDTLAASTVAITANQTGSQGLSTNSGTSSAVSSSFDVTTPTSNTSSLGNQGADWWVFPGGTLRMPASVMTALTGNTQTQLSRVSLDRKGRLRFDTASVHRYASRVALRDAAVAYFAGVREVQPFVTTYIASQDPPQFTFTSYDASQWVLTNVNALDTGPITTAGVLYSVHNSGFDTDINDWIQAQGTWTWDGSVGHFYLGTARVTADGTEKVLQSNEIDVAPGAHIDSTVWVTWTGLTATAATEAIQLQALFYNNCTYVSSLSQGLSYNPWPASTPETAGNVWAQIVATQAAETGFTVPAGVNQMRLALVVTADATAGQINFDTVEVGTPDSVEGTAFKDFVTTSTFSRLNCSFTDSGLVRSDDMWAQSDPNDTNISSTSLAYYTSTIPDLIPAGMWGDTIATWGDPNIEWGEPRAVVAINVDPDRTYDGKRVLHFVRAAGAGEAGIKVRQVTNFTASGLFRLGCVFFKPYANANQITIRLRRISDGVYIHEETFDPTVGYWYNYVTPFIEIPDNVDQTYTVEFVLTGDAADEIYLNDLYTEVSGVRYFCRLGDESAFLHDVTALAYADTAIVSSTQPVNEFSIEVAILSPKAWAYGGTFRPLYLK